MAVRRKISPPQPSVPDAWEAREDLRTLQRAEEIRKDAKRIAAADREAKAQMEALARARRLTSKKL